MDWELLDQLIENGYIKAKQHPTADLFIYNYTAKTQYERNWNEWTLRSRGLIMNEKREIVARPFAKFFNLGEMESQVIPNETFSVYDKLDGSLGILYWLEDEVFMATRGSFISEQAVKATEMLRSTYKEALAKLDRTNTYLFEIIYPENRIVVDYGSREELVLLGVVNNTTGEELDLVDVGFPLVTAYNGINNIHELKAMEEDNREGFVIRFKSGLRIKVKFDEYQRIHRIVTSISSLDIWASLRDKKSFEEILERVPDEFYDWVRATERKITTDYRLVEETAKRELKEFPTMRETAAYTLSCQYPAVMFSMLKGKNYEPIIWKFIRPDHEKPFSATIREELE